MKKQQLHNTKTTSKLDNLEKTITVTTPITVSELVLDAAGNPVPLLDAAGVQVVINGETSIPNGRKNYWSQY